ncbi:MAG: hypothetical protein AAFU41_09335 [Pseudomonadota bacterium]
MFELTAPIPSRSDLDWCWYLRRHGKTGEALERVLHDIGVLQPGGWANWQPSSITDTGAPVEMQFTEDQSALWLWTEVDDPASDPITRLSKALQVITAIGATPPSLALRDVIAAAQSDGPLSFGARLGLKQTATSLGVTLFAEVTDTAADLTTLLATGVMPPAQDAATRMTMLGYCLGTQTVTLYYDTEAALKTVLAQLTAIAGVPVEPLHAQIDHMMAAAHPDGTLGKLRYALRYTPGHKRPELTVFLSAKSAFLNDAAITREVRNFPGAHMPGYEALIDMHVPAPRGQSLHGDVGFQAQVDGRPRLSIAVAAPWHCPIEVA